MSAEPVALARIEGALQEGAEDGGFDVFPFGGGGESEDLELLAVEREGFDGFEEAAIEAEDDLAKDGGVAAGIHGSPEGFDHGLKVGQIFAQAGEEVGEAVGREEVDVLGEAGEDAAHEERGDGFRGVILFEGSGEGGEVAGDVAGDAGGDAAGVEREGVEPDGAEAVANELEREVFEADAVGEGIGEGDVGLAGAGEIGEEFDGIADVDDDEEGGPALVGGERFGVLLGLIAGTEHGLIPAGGIASGGSATVRDFEEEGWFGSRAALFGFEDEAAAFVEIDETGAGEAGRVTEGYGALEDVVILGGVGDGRVGARDFQVVAEFGEEECVVGPFGGGRVAPPIDEFMGQHENWDRFRSMRV